jgi:hypothetical protein
VANLTCRKRVGCNLRHQSCSIPALFQVSASSRAHLWLNLNSFGPAAWLGFWSRERMVDLTREFPASRSAKPEINFAHQKINNDADDRNEYEDENTFEGGQKVTVKGGSDWTKRLRRGDGGSGLGRWCAHGPAQARRHFHLIPLNCQPSGLEFVPMHERVSRCPSLEIA